MNNIYEVINPVAQAGIKHNIIKAVDSSFIHDHMLNTALRESQDSFIVSADIKRPLSYNYTVKEELDNGYYERSYSKCQEIACEEKYS